METVNFRRIDTSNSSVEITASDFLNGDSFTVAGRSLVEVEYRNDGTVNFIIGLRHFKATNYASVTCSEWSAITSNEGVKQLMAFLFSNI